MMAALFGFIKHSLSFLLTLLLCLLLLFAWALHINSAWQNKDQKPPVIEPPALPKPDIKDTGVDEHGCIVIEGISICDKPSAEVHMMMFQPICALNAYPDFKYAITVKPPKREAWLLLQWMTDMVGISPNFQLVAGKFSHKVIAFAVIKDDQRYIVYDEDENFLAPDGTVYWDSVGTLAHELGHHLAGHTYVHNQSSHERELEADKFSGFVMGKLGATLIQAISTTDRLNEHDTESHPGRAKRVVAVREGWLQAQALKK